MDTNENGHAAPQPTVLWSGLDVFLIVLGIIAIFIAGFLLLRLWIGSMPGGILGNASSIELSAGAGALEGVALLGSVYFLGLKRRHLTWSAVGIEPASRNWLQWAALIGLGVIPLAGLIAAGIQLALGRPVENPQLPFLAPEGFSWFGAISMLLLGGILDPFAEEVFFRGVLYQWLRDRWGVWFGILTSSLLFGAAHGDIAVGGASAVLGLILAWVFERSHSLWPPVLIHVINNSVKIAALYILLASGISLNGL